MFASYYLKLHAQRAFLLKLTFISGDSLKIRDGLNFYKIGVGARSLNNSQTKIDENGWHIQSFGNMMKLNGDEGVS